MARRASTRRPLTTQRSSPAHTAAVEVGEAHTAADTAATDPGLFGPDSEAWRLDREAMLLLGAGPRALLLQLAHPAIAAGVAAHSDVRTDPWRRLDGTLRSYLRLIYGPTPVVRAEARRLHGLHGRVRGTDPTGLDYDARDPDLALWVHATLVDSTLVANDRWLGPLARDRAARFYAETIPLARLFGIREAVIPPDLDAFEAYVAAHTGAGGALRVTDEARDLAAFILRPPLPGALRHLPIPAAAYAWTLWPAVDLLPPAVRSAYGLDQDPWQRAVSTWLVAGWRAWRPILPTAFREISQARAADRRVAARQGGTRRSRPQ